MIRESSLNAMLSVPTTLDEEEDEMEEKEEERCVRTRLVPIDPSKFNVTESGQVIKETPDKDCETPTQDKIKMIMDNMKDLLLYKNQKYGDSALNPLVIFTKHIRSSDTKTASILVRLDDKLSRVRNAEELRTNDVCDIMGYCSLLLISMGVTKEDIEKFKD